MVGNPEDRFSQNEAHFTYTLREKTFIRILCTSVVSSHRAKSYFLMNWLISTCFPLQPGDNMRIVLRPRSSPKQDDYVENIRTLGLIIEQILGIEQA